MNKFFPVSFCLAFCGTFAAAQQTTCLSTNASVIGSYAYIATEQPFQGVGFTPPGTANNTTLYSNTSLGSLVGNINTGQTFTSDGVLYFDGAGHVLVSTTSSPLAASTQVGTYTVNSDCTINVALTDVFNTATSGPGVTTPTYATTNLIGIVLGGGSEIDLTLAQSSSSTNGNTPLISGEFASRLVIQLVRSFPYGCSSTSLTGSYGLIGTGYALVTASTTSTTTGTGTGTTTSQTAQPITFFASLTFDGNGNVIAAPVTAPSPLANFEYSGTYTVNLNCTGTMTLTTPSTTTTTTTGTGTTGTTSTTKTSLTVNFVLIPTVAYVSNSNTVTISSGSAGRPSLLFNTSSGSETLVGYGRAQ